MLPFQILLVVNIFCGFLSGTETLTLWPKRKERDFRLLCQTRTAAGNIPVSKYESLKTGIHVIIAKVEGPIVKGQLTFATEAHDSDGLPHALEHLVFMGSEDYPYKGVLDLLTNRCLAQGVNAWTDPDNTAYTVQTAGKEGFLNILPIYVDHLFYPTLKNSSYITEIHHLTGQGEDAGVLYSEMQEDENSQTEITSNALARILYPEPSGYRYEAGGILLNLRYSTTIQKVRNYHKKMYKPENLHIIISGQIEPREVFEALEDIESKIASEIPDESEPFVRPWKTPPPPFTESQDKVLVYPSDIEDTGVVRIGWRGPSLVSNIKEMYSMEVLIQYLIDSSTSPLNKVFVEVDDPFASYIDGYLLYYSVTSCILCFEGVPVNKIHGIKPLLQETLSKIANGHILFDVESMRITLESLILEENSGVETYPHDMLSEDITLDILYGHNCETLEQSINRIAWFVHLLTEPSSYWVNLINKYMVSSPVAVIRGVPSSARAETLQKEEKHRIAKRWMDLGEERLKLLQKEADEAMQLNEVVPPELLLESIPVPLTDNLKFHSIEVYTNIDNLLSSKPIPKANPSLFNMEAVPIKIQVDDVNSNFVQVITILETQSLTPSQRLYLPLLLELLLESPVENEVDVEEVGEGEDENAEEEEKVKEENETDEYDNILNFDTDVFDSYTFNGLDLSCSMFEFGKYSQNVGINFKVEMERYADGIEWLKLALFKVTFVSETVSVKVNKLLNSVGDKKRDGETILKLMFNDIIFKPDSNMNKANVFRQEHFLKEVMQTLRSNPKKILNDLHHIHRNITDLNRITIHMATNLQKLAEKTNVTKPWVDFTLNGQEAFNKSLNVISDWEERLPFEKNASITGFIVGIGSEESAYLKQTTPGITDYFDPDLPALLIAVSYLSQTEGPLWNSIRGKGLAYNSLLSMQMDQGMLVLTLEEATQLTEAYAEAIRIINSYLNGTIAWNYFLLESARGSLIYEIIEQEAEISDVVQQSIYTYYRKIPHNYNRHFLRALKKVKLDDLHAVALKYFKPLISVNLSRTFVICPHSKVIETEKGLNHVGHRMEVISSFKDSRFSHL